MVGAWCFGCLSSPPGFTCWISFAPIFTFIYCWVLFFALSPCYILILYVLGVDALISQGSFIQTKYIYVSWSTSELKVRLARCKNSLSPPVKYFTDRLRWYFFCGSFIFFCLAFALPLCVSVYMCLVVTCWERADLLAPVFGCLIVSLLLSHWYLGSGLVLDCIDSWSLHPYLLLVAC